MKKHFMGVCGGAALLVSQISHGACQWVWVDHDYNTSTPAIRKQVCESTLDLPATKPIATYPVRVVGDWIEVCLQASNDA